MQGDEARADRAAETMLADWREPAQHEAGPYLRRTTKEPGPIALRARWHYLRLLEDAGAHAASHAVSEDQWTRELDLEHDGDLALVRQDLPRARASFAELKRIASHPVVAVQALIGLADAARQDDEHATAERLYREAVEAADAIPFAFGVMRARLPLAYLVRRSGSAEQMLDIARECEASARALGDQIYVANAQVAQGEALDLLGRDDEAIGALNAALKAFSAWPQLVGVAAAGMRLLDVHRRREDSAAVLRLVPVVLEATRATGQLQEAVDVYDALAAAHTSTGDLDAALDACEAGLSLAGDAYPRGVAHLRMSQGLALRLSGDPEAAARDFQGALDYFQSRPNDLWMTAYCLGHLADCAEDLDALADAVRLRMFSLESIEAMRSAQVSPRWQQEYRRRFDTVYRGALMTAVRAQDPDAFCAVFESLWGRRLPGIAEGTVLDAASDPVLIAQLVALNERARRQREGRSGTDEERRARALGGVALGGALPDMYADAVDATLAGAFRPLDMREGRALLLGLAPDAAVLLICEVPGEAGRLAWLCRAPGGRPELGDRVLTPLELELLGRYSTGWPLGATAADCSGLSDLLPAAIAAMEEGTRLQLIPLERLWSLPWNALAAHGGFVGATFDVMVSPSLTLAATRTAGPGPGVPPGEAGAAACIGPEVMTHDLRGMRGAAADKRSAEAAAAAHRALVMGDTASVVVVAHGRLVGGMGHYLELSDELLLTPADLLSGTPPRSVALVSCWGAHTPEPSAGEPLTIGTICLARGARQVLTTMSELGDNAIAAAVVNDVLWRAAEEPWATALRRTLARRATQVVREPISDWAPLTAMGAW